MMESLHRLTTNQAAIQVLIRISLFRLDKPKRLVVGFSKENFRLVVCKIRDLHRHFLRNFFPHQLILLPFLSRNAQKSLLLLATNFFYDNVKHMVQVTVFNITSHLELTINTVLDSFNFFLKQNCLILIRKSVTGIESAKVYFISFIH